MGGFGRGNGGCGKDSRTAADPEINEAQQRNEASNRPPLFQRVGAPPHRKGPNRSWTAIGGNDFIAPPHRPEPGALQ